MRTVELFICALLLAAGEAGRSGSPPATGPTTSLPPVSWPRSRRRSSLLRDRPKALERLGPLRHLQRRLSVSVASFWTGIVRPLRRSNGAPSWTGSTGSTTRGWSCWCPIPAVMVLTLLWCEAALHVIKQAAGGERRRRARSDLHGRAALLDRRSVRRLAKRRGILLGQWGREGTRR